MMTSFSTFADHPTRTVRRRCLSAAAIMVAALAHAAEGATITWLPDADGNWSTKADWSGGNLPRNTDDVVIDVGGATVRTITHSVGTDSVLTLFSNENVVLSGGQLTLASLSGAAMSTINANFTVSGGTLFGSGDLTVNGALNWNAGAISGGGTTIVGSAASLTIDTSAAIVTLSRTLENDSTAASWTGTSNFVFSGGTFNNIAGAVFTTSANASMANNGGNNNFNNAGTFNRTGAGTTTVVVSFNNSGTVNVQGGTLALSGGGDNTGLLNVASGAGLNVTLGTYVFDAGTVVSGPGTLGLSGGILSVAQPSTVNAPWTISGGTISGVADITANGAVSWTGGTMTSTGTTVISSTGSLAINTAASTVTLGRPLQNNGTVNWLTGPNNIGFSGGTFNNAVGAVFSTSAVASMVTVAGGNAFNNAGTFNRSGAGTTTIAIPFNNSGSVNVQGGTLSITGGGAQTAPFVISDGAGLSLNGTHTFSAAATITASGTGALDILGGASTFDGVVGLGGPLGIHAGTATFNAAASAASLSINGGTINFNSTGSFPSASLSAGTLSGAGDATVSGSLNWTNGTMAGVGKTIIAATGSLNVTTAATGLTLSRVLENNGTTSWTSGGTFGISFANGTFNNQPGATFNAAGTTSLNNTSGTNAFNNAGTFNQTAVGTTTLAIPFNNSATVNVQGGSLVLSGGGNNTGSFNISSSTAMNVTAGTYTFNTGTVVSGTGTFGLTGGTLSIAQASAVNSPWTISNGTLNGVGDVTANGVLTWSGGTMSGTGKTVVGATGLLNLSTTASVTLSRILENNGSINWAAGTSNVLFAGGTLNNQPGASFTSSVSDSLINNAGGGNAFNNAGTYNEAGAGTFTIAIPLNNTGTVNVQSGTLSLTGSVVQVAGPTLTGGTWNISNAATLNIPLTTLTSNAGNITLDGPASSFTAINNLTINSGSFAITNGRTFTTAGGFTNSGTLAIGSGSTFTMAAVQPYNQTAGVTNLQGGALAAAAGINISSGSLVGSGTINGNLAVGGILSPGNSAGSISIAGNLNLGGASQSLFQLGGTGAGTFDIVSASGTATLAGTLGLSFINGFQTSIKGSDTFTILTSGSPLSGAFSNIANGGRLATTDGFGKFRVVYSGNSLVLSDFNTVRWLPDANGDWATATNWSSGPGLPSPTDDVLIDVGGATVRTITHSTGIDSIKSLNSNEALVVSGGSLSIAGVSTIADSLTVSSGTLTTDSALTVAGNVIWSGGILSGTGALNANGGLSLSGAQLILSQKIVNNSRQATWSAGQISSGNGAIFNNLLGGTFLASFDGVFAADQGGALATFNNAGTFSKTAGAGTSTFSTAFNNTGTVNVQSGTLSLSGGGTQTGAFNLAPGTALDFHGGIQSLNAGADINGPAASLILSAGTVTLNDAVNVGNANLAGAIATVNGSFTNAGTMAVTGGVTTFNPSSTIPAVGTSINISNGELDFNSLSALSTGALAVTGGALGGSSALSVSGNVAWSGGALTGTGTLNANGGLTLSGSQITLSQKTVNNAGTATWTSGQISTGNGAIFNNLAAATFNNAFDGIFAYDQGGILSVFNNAGTFAKTAGSGATTFSSTFNNTGTVNVQSGTLSLSGGGTQSGAFNLSPGTALNFSGGTHILNTGAVVSGPAANLTLGGGSITFNDSVNVGSINLAGATASFNGAFANAGALTVSGGLTTFGPASTITSVGTSINVNGGVVNFNSANVLSTSSLSISSGTLGGSSALNITGPVALSGGTLNGTGALNANGGMTLSGAAVILSQKTVNNTGVATWNAGQIGTGNGAVFNNLATAIFNNTFDGTFAFDQGGTPSTFNNAGTFSKTAGSGTTTISTTFNNTGSVIVQSGTLSLTGPVTQISGSALSGGTWNILGNSTLNIPAANITSSAANITLSGPDSAFPALNSLASNSGSLNLTGGRSFISASAFTNSGTLNLGSGSTLTTAAGQAYSQISGTTSLQGGTLASATGVSIASGSLTGSGTINGNLSVGGTFSPGNSAGSIVITGNLSLSGTAQSLFELGGTATGSFDTVNVTGLATLGGNLGLSFINAFQNSVKNSDTFTILTSAAPISSAFNNVASGARLKITGGLGTLLVNYSGNSVVLNSFVAGTAWLPNNDGDWAVAGNWSSAPALPGPADDVILDVGGPTARTITHSAGTDAINSLTSQENLVLSGGSLSLAQASQINGSLILSATLAGAGNVTVSSLDWQGGLMAGSGHTIIPAGGALSASTAGSKTLSRVIDNSGAASYTGGTLTFNGGTFNNNAGATFNTAIAGALSSAGGINAFNNAGTFTKAAANSFDINVPFNNNGMVSIQGGNLNFNSGGVNSAVIDVTAGAAASFTGSYTHAAASSITGAGAVSFTGGVQDFSGQLLVTGPISVATTVNFNSAQNLSGPLSLTGTLSGTANVTAAGSLAWTGGSMSGSGHMVIAAATTLTIGGATTLSRVLDDFGATSYTGGTLTFNGGTFNNNSTFSAGAGGTLANGGGINLFSNTGAFTKSGASSFDVNIPFSNSGSVSVQGGTLNLNGAVPQISGSALTGGIWSLSGNSMLSIPGANITSSAASVTFDGPGASFPAFNSLASNSGSLTLSNGNLFTTAGAFVNTGTIQLAGGTFANIGASVNNAGQISGWGAFTTSNAGLDNQGSIAFSGGLTTVHGPVTNENGKTITIAQNPAVFTGMVTNNVGGTFNAVNTTVSFAGGFTNNDHSNFVKAGGGTIEVTAAPRLNNGSALSVTAGTLRFNVASGTPTIGTGVSAIISSGATLELAGTASALANGSNRVAIVNNSAAPGVLVSGTRQQVGNIDGSGNTQVDVGSDLTANHIIQAALVIGGTTGSHGLMTIAASDASGNPLGQSSGQPTGLSLGNSLESPVPHAADISSTSLIDGSASSGSGSPIVSASNSLPPAGVMVVPEPSTILLFAVAMAGLLAHTCRARRRVG